MYGIIEQFAKNTEPINAHAMQHRIINLQYLKELSMGDAEFEHAIIRQFIVQVPEELELLKDAIAKANLQRIKSLAHGMKSSIAYLGLGERLNPCLQRMETDAVLNNPHPHFHEDYATLLQVCNEALAEAKQLQLHSA